MPSVGDTSRPDDLVNEERSNSGSDTITALHSKYEFCVHDIRRDESIENDIHYNNI